MTIGNYKDVDYDFKTARQRLKENPIPEIHLIPNDTQLGWLYNNGARFSNSEFEKYVYGLDISKRAKRIRFITGINLFGKEVIRYAVLHFE